MILPRPIRIWTEHPIRADGPTTLRVEGHPEIDRLNVPSSELRGWDGHLLIIEGIQVEAPAEDAPWWHFEGERSTIMIEVRSAVARRSGAPLYALVEWAPGAPIRKSIAVVGDQWTDADLLAAGYALRRLHDEVAGRDRGQPKRYDAANEPQFFEDLGKAAHAAANAGDRVTYASLARHGLASRPTVKAAVELYGYDLDAIGAEAVRCTRRANTCAFLWRDRAKFKRKEG